MDGRGIPENQASAPGPNLLRRLERHLWRRMFAGFLVLIPLLVTLIVLGLVIGNLDKLFRPLVPMPFDVPGIGLVISLVLLYAVGSLLTGRLGRRAINWQGAVLCHIPVVKNIYGVANQATEALSAPSEHKFSRVVFLEWPRPGVRALGFVTGHVHAQGEGHRGTVVVYIPTVPNPTSGMLAWVDEDDVMETDITVEDAMKAVFSGGDRAAEVVARVGAVQDPANALPRRRWRRRLELSAAVRGARGGVLEGT